MPTAKAPVKRLAKRDVADEETVVSDPPPVVQSAPRRVVHKIYAYHPADTTPDLWLPTNIASHYHVANMDHRRPIDPSLENDIAENGILLPISIYTNGLHALIGDGSHRVRIAMKLGLEKVPVQVLPDNMRRKASRCGHPVLESVLDAWV